MFIRQCYRIRNGKRYAYWALVKSRRTQRGPRQHIVSYIGQADEMVREGIKQAAQGSTDRQRKLFGDVEPEYAEVDVKRVRVERCREFGGPWLGLPRSSTWAPDSRRSAAPRVASFSGVIGLWMR